MRSNVSKVTVSKTAKKAMSIKPAKNTKVWNNIAPNISKTPANRYRVRVCGEQILCSTQKEALATRKNLYMKHGKV